MVIEVKKRRKKMSNTINDSTLAFYVVQETPAVRFLASLSDGRTVIQDNREGQANSWVRLAAWLKVNSDVSITGIRLQGPNGIDIKTPSNQQGYFFGYKQNAVWGSALQGSYVGIGYFDGQKVNVSWHRQPLFDYSFTEDRTIANAGFFLIRNT